MPSPSVNLVGLELVVPDLDAALALLVEALGLEVVERRRSEDPAGEIAVLLAGAVGITLLQPSDAGPGHVLADRQPRVTQLVFGADPREVDNLMTAIAELGISVQLLDAERFFVPPAAAQGVLGVRTAVVVAAVAVGGAASRAHEGAPGAHG
jgi:catechol 2,3-dioxygenase-like lactoylglutathione lyase family enzyme